jgi:hypothetical protein
VLPIQTTGMMSGAIIPILCLNGHKKQLRSNDCYRVQGARGRARTVHESNVFIVLG